MAINNSDIVKTLLNWEYSMEKIPEPRTHHYVYAHQVLRDLILQENEQILPIFASPSADEFLFRLWDEVAKSIPEHETVTRDGLCCIPLQMIKNDLAISVICMPEAIYPPEAIYVVILFKISTEQCRYITLEKSLIHVMICEWTSEGVHRNLGLGVKDTHHETLSLNNFLELVVTELPVEEW